MSSYRIRADKAFKKEYKRLSKKYRSLENDLITLSEGLKTNPFIGVDLGNGIRKIRMTISSKGKGKSHGARVITNTTAIVNVDEEGVVTLLYIYDKGERASITSNEIAELLKNL